MVRTISSDTTGCVLASLIQDCARGNQECIWVEWREIDSRGRKNNDKQRWTSKGD